jgi:group I intron endonuclease
MFYVYKLTNKLNSKVYIGKSLDALKRLRIHIKIAKGGKEKYPRKFHAIHAAISKYGIENFYFEILHEVDSEEQAFELETKEVLYLKTNGVQIYNLSDGGEGNSGWHHTEESKKKMSAARRGKKFSEEHRKSLSEAQSGNRHSQFGGHQSTKWKEAKSKLTFNQIIEIKNMLHQQKKSRDIAKLFSVSESTISQIKHNKIWQEAVIDITPE